MEKKTTKNEYDHYDGNVRGFLVYVFRRILYLYDYQQYHFVGIDNGYQ